MDSGKVALFILLLVLLVLIGCGHGFRNGVTQKAQDDTVCLKRADLKLIAAALNSDTATMEAAIKSGADVNVAIEGLGPSIVVASVGDNYSGVQLLLDRGANINAEDSEGHTALINASLGNTPAMVRLLLSKGANVNAPSNLMVKGKKAGFTPLMIAKGKGWCQGMIARQSTIGRRQRRNGKPHEIIDRSALKRGASWRPNLL